MDCDELKTLSRVLSFGCAESRRSFAEMLAARNDPEIWGLLAETVHSDGPWRLRARCLETLGIAAGCLDKEKAESILKALLKPPEAAPSDHD